MMIQRHLKLSWKFSQSGHVDICIVSKPPKSPAQCCPSTGVWGMRCLDHCQSHKWPTGSDPASTHSLRSAQLERERCRVFTAHNMNHHEAFESCQHHHSSLPESQVPVIAPVQGCREIQRAPFYFNLIALTAQAKNSSAEASRKDSQVTVDLKLSFSKLWLLDHDEGICNWLETALLVFDELSSERKWKKQPVPVSSTSHIAWHAIYDGQFILLYYKVVRICQDVDSPLYHQELG